MKLSQKITLVSLVSCLLLSAYILIQKNQDRNLSPAQNDLQEDNLSKRSRWKSEIDRGSRSKPSIDNSRSLFHQLLGLQSDHPSIDEESEALSRKMRTLGSVEEFRELLLVIPPEFCHDKARFENLWKFYPIEDGEMKFTTLLSLALELKNEAVAGSTLSEAMFFMLGKNIENGNYPDLYQLLHKSDFSDQELRRLASGFADALYPSSGANEEQKESAIEYLTQIFDQSDDRFAALGAVYARLIGELTDLNLALNDLIVRFADRPKTQYVAYKHVLGGNVLTWEQVGLLVNSMNWNNPGDEQNFLNSLIVQTVSFSKPTSEEAFAILQSFSRQEDRLVVAKIFGRIYGRKIGEGFLDTIPADLDPDLKEAIREGYQRRVIDPK